jgi:oligoendopeptidase F
VLTRFEEASFAARKERRLTPERVRRSLDQGQWQVYGDAVEMPEGYRWGWSYILTSSTPAFIATVSVFWTTLVLALYRMYREEDKSFVPKYSPCWNPVVR